MVKGSFSVLRSFYFTCRWLGAMEALQAAELQDQICILATTLRSTVQESEIPPQKVMLQFGHNSPQEVEFCLLLFPNV